MGDAVEQLVLPLRRPTPLPAHGLGRGPREGVDAHPPLRSGHGAVFGLPVLERIRLEQKAAKNVVADAPLPLRGTNTRLVDRAGEGRGERSINPSRRSARVEPRVAVKEADDVGMIAPLGLRGEIHPRTSPAFEPTSHPDARQEDRGFDVRSALLGERLLRLQQTDQLLRFPVRQQKRTVDKEFLAVDLSAPSVRVARDHTVPALDLDQVHLVERHDEQIDFVDAAVLGDEFEVRPGAKGLAVGEAGLDVVEGLALPGVFGGGDLGPAGRFHCRVVTWSGWTMASRLPESDCRHSIDSACAGRRFARAVRPDLLQRGRIQSRRSPAQSRDTGERTAVAAEPGLRRDALTGGGPRTT